MSEIKVTQSTRLKLIPAVEELGFGKYYTDHMLVMDYSPEQGWRNGQIIPHEQFELWPETAVLHYGQAVFEGIKAFRTVKDEIVLFRPSEYLQRLNRSANILCIPEVDMQLLSDGLQRLVEMDKRWVPAAQGASLYIRPVIMAMDRSLSVKPAATYKLFVILSPVGAYYAGGFNPVSIKVEEEYVRAIKGGIGEAKTPANYAASMRAQVAANAEGFDQVLWLDAQRRKYVEEVGTMNIFFKIKGELVTPALNGSILGGITRKTVIEQAKRWGYNVIERRISITEIRDAYRRGELEEVFGSGTAAVVSPVGELSWKGQTMVINNKQTGELAQRLFDYITGIQYGILPDENNWNRQIAVN